MTGDSKRRAVVLGLCLVPLCFSLPGLSQPYGTSEDGLNAAIWQLGARNLLRDGVAASLRGAVVAPYPGTTGNGVYAHHPPLPVWVMTASVALGEWEGWARLFALACLATSLLLLARLLEKVFEPLGAVVAMAATALCGYALVDGRLFNTLTLATPFFLLVLSVTFASVTEGRRWPKWTPLAVVALVLSSWDGVLGAAVLLPVLTSADLRRGERSRALIPALSGLAAALFVAWHLVDATGGTAELRWQLAWRASGSEFTWPQWLARQGSNLAAGLGPLTLLLLFAAPLGWAAGGRDRKALLLFALAAAPGVLMLLVFRQGAQHHAFWGHNLLLPGAVAVAMAVTWVRGQSSTAASGVLAAGLLIQVGWSVAGAVLRQREERAANGVGALVARRFGPASPRPVPMFTDYAYHPYVTFYARAPPDCALNATELAARADDGRWSPQAQVLVDGDYTRRLRCRPYPTLDASPSGRWVVTNVRALRDACAP